MVTIAFRDNINVIMTMVFLKQICAKFDQEVCCHTPLHSMAAVPNFLSTSLSSSSSRLVSLFS